jgi:hypothetical protein
MVTRQTLCLKRLGGNRAGELQTGRFFANPKVTPAKSIASWSERTGAACCGRHVLAIDDTTEVKFPTQARRRRGLGPVKKGKAYGLLAHTMIAVDAVSGACLGLVGGEIWTRPGVNPIPHAERPLAERESMRWLRAAAQARRVLEPAAMATVVDDREADIYARWATAPAPDFHLLSRGMNDRRLTTDEMLFAAMAWFPLAGQRTIALPARPPDRAERTAVVQPALW